MKKIAIASDHAGYPLKKTLKTHLDRKAYVIQDFGTDGGDPVDYPDYIYPGARSVAAGQCDIGIVIGGSGNGEAMVANKVRGVRCALCWNVQSAKLAREHNNANSDHEQATLPRDKREAVSGKAGLWIEVACP